MQRNKANPSETVRRETWLHKEAKPKAALIPPKPKDAPAPEKDLSTQASPIEIQTHPKGVTINQLEQPPSSTLRIVHKFISLEAPPSTVSRPQVSVQHTHLAPTPTPAVSKPISSTVSSTLRRSAPRIAPIPPVKSTIARDAPLQPRDTREPGYRLSLEQLNAVLLATSTPQQNNNGGSSGNDRIPSIPSAITPIRQERHRQSIRKLCLGKGRLTQMTLLLSGLPRSSIYWAILWLVLSSSRRDIE